MGEPVRYDGLSAAELAVALDLPRVELYRSATSTLDVAHKLAAAGAPAGTLVLAEEQSAGRGRDGKRWASESGAGIWLALLERPGGESAVESLTVRIGLGAAAVLDRHAASPVMLKWPNDLYVGDGKVAGILVESRWREGRVEWLAIGVGINVLAPRAVAGAAAVAGAGRRVEILAELVPALRVAASARGALTDQELESYAQRHYALGRACIEPVPGRVAGLTRDGSLLVDVAGRKVEVRTGSLILAEDKA